MARAAMGKTGQAALSSSRVTALSITRLSASAWKLAVAMALPKTSCAQVRVEGGQVVMVLETSRSSRLSRGRSIRRCGPRRTGWR